MKNAVPYFRNVLFACSMLLNSYCLHALDKPNLIVYFADDISAREIPVYGSTVWSKPTGGDSTDLSYRAKTPVLDRLATEGCWIKTAWAATVCNPSRAMMMTGRYAHLHKWWNNKDKGRSLEPNGKFGIWPIYKSSPILIGHVAQKAGYGTFWTGKTQMAGDLREYGFDEGCFTPGELSDTDNPYADFKLVDLNIDGKKVLVNLDSGEVVDTYRQHGWYWHPHVRLMNHPDEKKDFVWWPNTQEARENFGINTYGPDVELEFAFDFMDRQQQAGRPFFIYHTTHLGHDAFDWFNPKSESKWPGTPIVQWDGEGYIRIEPQVTGDEGEYNTNGSVSEPGIHNHINYIDYQIWLYRNKLQEMGIEDNTVFIFCADNGTSGYGKNSGEKQKGCHIPMIIYMPGMKKHGEQDVLVSVADILPTIAEMMGVRLPEDYEINGESLVSFLSSNQPFHRKWLYAHRGKEQLVRGNKIMKDGRNKWWDVSDYPEDLISFSEVKDINVFSEMHRSEAEMLNKILPQFDLYESEYDAPDCPPYERPKKNQKSKKGKTK